VFEPAVDRLGRSVGGAGPIEVREHVTGATLQRGKHEPLVSPGLWQQVQDVLTAQNYACEKSRQHQHYLKGTVFCGNCGDRLVIHEATGKTGMVYPYFVCQGRHESAWDPRRLRTLEVRMEHGWKWAAA
jgi:hypothetical protein